VHSITGKGVVVATVETAITLEDGTLGILGTAIAFRVDLLPAIGTEMGSQETQVGNLLATLFVWSVADPTTGPQVFAQEQVSLHD